jgi:hypothetical protein
MERTRTYYGGPRLAGLFLVGLGALFLLGSVIGVTVFVVSKLIWPVALLLIGAGFLERQVNKYRVTGRLALPWPVFLILIGVWMLMNRR